MQIQPGSVVYSKAGHDKGGLFLVLQIENDCVYLADGKLRKLEKPKKKKQKHLQGTNHVLQLDETLLSNAGIRKALAQFKPIQ